MLDAKEIWCVSYFLTIETICIFLIPAYCLLIALYRKPANILRQQRYSWNDQIHSPLILALCFLTIANIPGINMLSQLNTDGVLSVVGEDSDLWANYQRMNDYTEMLLVNSNSLLLNLFCMAIVPAICEEIFFRGCLQTMATNVLKKTHVAVILIAAVFSILHGDVFNFLPRFVLGIFLGYLFVYTKNILFPIVAHCLHNSCVVLLSSYSAFSEEIETIGTTDNKLLLGIASLLILIGFTAKMSKRVES